MTYKTSINVIDFLVWFASKFSVILSNFNPILGKKSPRCFPPNIFGQILFHRNFEDFHRKLHRNLAKSHRNFFHRKYFHRNFFSPKFFALNVTGLSANQLCQARSKAWCFTYNEMQRGRSNRPAELSYEEADYQDLLQTIKNHPVLHSIDRSVENSYGMREISALALRIGRELQGNR